MPAPSASTTLSTPSPAGDHPCENTPQSHLLSSFEDSFGPDLSSYIDPHNPSYLKPRLSNQPGPQVFPKFNCIYDEHQLFDTRERCPPPMRLGCIPTPADNPLDAFRPPPILHARHEDFFDPHETPDTLDAGSELIEWLQYSRQDTELLERDELEW